MTADTTIFPALHFRGNLVSSGQWLPIANAAQGFSEIPQSVTVTVSALDALEKVEYDKAIRKIVKDEIQNTDKKAVENNAILKRIKNRLNSLTTKPR